MTAVPGATLDRLSLRGATLIDGSGADPRTGLTVSIDGDRITSVGTTTEPGASDLDLAGLTLLPGLIDAHTHLAAAIGLQQFANAGSISVAELAGLIFRNCQLALEAGFTTCRDTGGLDGGIVRAIEQGIIQGPRIFPSGPVICQDGGHGSQMPQWTDCWCPLAVPGLAQLAAVCNSADEVRAAARRNFRRGATQLKLIVTGGVVSFTDALEDVQLTVDEIRAAVDEADNRNTYVTVHAHNCRGIRNGLAAGVTCVEHGTHLDVETAAAMAKAGAALVPTLTVCHLMVTDYKAWGLFDEVVPRVQGAEAAMKSAIKLAREAGVLIGAGTDLLGPEQNRRGLELVLRAQVEDPMAAIVSQTSANARIMRQDHRLGTVEAGKLADLIGVDFDPLAHPELFDDPSRVVLVIKGGKIVKQVPR